MSDDAASMLKSLDGRNGMDWTRQFAVDYNTEILRCWIDERVVAGDDMSLIQAVHRRILELQAGTAIEIIRKSAAKAYPATQHAELTDGKGARSPRYPSGIEAIDEETDGFYGCTLLGGESGVGKSLLGTGASLLAAMSGWRVCYGNCEMKTSEISRRVRAFVGQGDRGFLSRWHCIDLFHGATLEKFVCEVEEKCHKEDEKILLVIDSLNSFVRKMGQIENGYFRAIDDVCAFGETVVRKSNGRVGLLLVSELNKNGGIKGGSSEYVCCLDVRMKHGADQKDVTEISTEKGREGGGYRSYGSYYPDFKTCSFKYLPDAKKETRPHQDRPEDWEL